MSLNLRKVVIGFLVLAVLVSAYVAFRQVDDSPSVEMETRELAPMPLADPVAAPRRGEVGRIAGVEITKVESTEFFHTDESGRIDRKFGFDELIHSEGDQWVITNPYMMLYLGEINCRVTANQGQVQVETAFNQPQPNDALFSGNVVIRIVPTDPNDPRAVFIYLDDVAFIAEQSLFSTNGAVKFVSRSAQLVGRGMELLYDDPARRLQLFRIRDLESLRLRSDEFGSLSLRGGPDDIADGTGVSEAEEAGPDVMPPVAEAAAPGLDVPVEPNAAGSGPDVYECVFHRNVTISTPDQFIRAWDRFTIGNILWSNSGSKTDGDETAKASGGGEATGAGEPNATKGVGVASESVPFRGPGAIDTTPSESFALDAIPESFFDIVVSCDGGFVVAPKGSSALLPDPNWLGTASDARLAGLSSVSEKPAVDPNRQTVVARRIAFDAAATDTTLTGPVAITFAVDANSFTGRNSADELMPVTITARDAVRYLSAANRIELEGRCAVTLEQSEPNYTYEYMLTAPMLALDLREDPNAGPDDTGIVLKRFAAAGGPVAFNAQRRRAGVDLVGWVQLYAARLDYDEAEKEFRITGPAKINLHNGEDLDPEADPNGFSVGRPCYAFIQDFDTLTYSTVTNQVLAENQSDPISLHYFPQVDGGYDPNGPEAYAGRIEIELAETAEDHLELVSLTASEGIEYVDVENRFYGATLFYDHAASLLTVEGDAALPCLLNGAAVDRIEMDPKTGDIKAKIGAPSTVQVSR